jgi:hypothetical protein
MKRQKIIIFAIVLFLIAGAGATSSYAIGFSAGIKGGMGLSNLYNDAEKIRLNGGLMASFDIHFLNWLSCEVNLGWRNRGFKNDTYGSNSTDYFDFEALAKIFLTPRKPMGFYLLIGGYIGGPMTSKSGSPRSYGTGTSDVGMTVGGGVNLAITKRISVIIETYGLIGFKTAGSDASEGSNGGQKWIAGYLMGGIMFDF